MKKILWCLLIFVLSNICSAQEWMSSLDVAQRLARVQNKMLFVMWEESTFYDFPVQLVDDGGNMILTDLFKDEKISEILWDHFIPVYIPEYKYDELYSKIKGKRTTKYIDKFNDDSIKIMDANGNILNVDYANEAILDLKKIIDTYAINIKYLQSSLLNYSKNYSLASVYRLALKYYEFAIFNHDDIKEDLIDLGTVYLDEARELISKDNLKNEQELLQKCEFMEFKSYLVLDKPKKVLRNLKKLEPDSIIESNKPLYAFLYYTAYIMLQKDKDASIWKSQVSLVDLKKAQLIINSTQ